MTVTMGDTGTEAGHTAGPWSIDRIDAHDWHIIGKPDGVVAEIVATVHNTDCGFGKADARLIAAAPDLLGALTALVNSFETHRPKALWDNARAAIAKAQGAAS